MAKMIRYAVVLCTLALGLRTEGQMLTSQYDNARSGANLNQTNLTPRNVSPQHLSKVFTLSVDGDIYAQPPWRGDSRKRPARCALRRDGAIASKIPPVTGLVWRVDSISRLW